MSAYLGDFRIGKTVRKMWNSNAIAGESITRATNGTVSVYKDGGTTQSTTGVTDTEDFDSLTGVHLVAVDTSADGTFYSAGSDFEVVLSAATIDGKTINATLFSFSLENRSALMPTTDGRKLDVSSGGEAGVDWANVGSPTTSLNLSGTTISTSQAIASVSGAVGSVTGNVGGNVAGSVGSLTTNNDKTGYSLSQSFPTNFASLSITAGGVVKADLETIKTQTVTCGAGVTVLASVGTAATSTAQTGDAYARIGAPAGASLVADLGTATSATQALILPVKAVTDKLDTALELDGEVYRYTTNALEQGPAGSGATAQEVWEYATRALSTSPPTAAAIASQVRTELTTELGRIDVATSTRLATAGYTAPLDAAGVRTAVGLAAANLDTQLADLPTVAEFEARTLAAASYATATALDTVDNLLDTEIAAIKTKTDLIPASPAATGDIPSAASVATAVLTTAMTESYNADGAAPTLAQAQFVTMQRLTEFAIAGTTITVKKLDGSTTAYTLTLDDDAAPTSSTRAT